VLAAVVIFGMKYINLYLVDRIWITGVIVILLFKQFVSCFSHSCSNLLIVTVISHSLVFCQVAGPRYTLQLIFCCHTREWALRRSTEWSNQKVIHSPFLKCSLFLRKYDFWGGFTLPSSVSTLIDFCETRVSFSWYNLNFANTGLHCYRIVSSSRKVSESRTNVKLIFNNFLLLLFF